ncbi:MAG: glycerol kinase GlpK [Planctomycetes bacterium]|nr:glycerol kinase GlpK [Planctomycetota bacterium]
MTRSHILAFDQGTTSSRSILFDSRGAIRAVAQQEFRQSFPKSGWVEHDAQEIWSTQLETAKECLHRAGLGPRDVAAIAITNQRETTVIWERSSGRPIAPAIVWQDRRTAHAMEKLRADGVEPRVRKKTGLLLDPYFSASKMAWILDHVTGARKRAAKGELAAGTIDSWLLWKLTGGRVHKTDVTNACRTSLLDLKTLSWNPEMLSIFNVPAEILPEVVSCDNEFGECEPKLLGGAIPIRSMIGDQQAALFGQLCFEKGMAKNTFGTGCFMLMQTGTKPAASKNRLLSTVAWRMEGKPAHYALEGSVFVGGSAVQWLRDGLGIIKKSADVNPLAESVPDSDGVFVVPAFAGLGAPTWDPRARGCIVGLTRGSTAAHIARATLEGIAHQVADVLEAMTSDAGAPVGILRVDGGACASDLLMQTQADLLNAAVERPKVIETTAQGAAFVAGLACGIWKDAAELSKHRAVDHVFKPKISEDERRTRRANWKRALARAGDWQQGETK